MCGIAGAVGLKDISNVLFDGIRNLEYRGYDSCGVALMNGKGIVVKKISEAWAMCIKKKIF